MNPKPVLFRSHTQAVACWPPLLKAAQPLSPQGIHSAHLLSLCPALAHSPHRLPWSGEHSTTHSVPSHRLRNLLPSCQGQGCLHPSTPHSRPGLAVCIATWYCPAWAAAMTIWHLFWTLLSLASSLSFVLLPERSVLIPSEKKKKNSSMMFNLNVFADRQTPLTHKLNYLLYAGVCQTPTSHCVVYHWI